MATLLKMALLIEITMAIKMAKEMAIAVRMESARVMAVALFAMTSKINGNDSVIAFTVSGNDSAIGIQHC